MYVHIPTYFAWFSVIAVVVTNIGLCTAITPVVIHEDIIWETGLGEISAYRSPVMVNTPGGLLAFCGARKYSSADTGAKIITMRRSLDKGQTWKPTVFLVDDFDAPNGLNIGIVVVDTDKKMMLMTFSFCVHNYCPEHVPRNYIMRSYDWGYSWTEPEDMAVKSPLFQGWPYGFGPGYGIIKQHKPNIGRIFGCGHSVDRNHLASQAMYCLYSDDGGDTWTIGATLYSIPYGVPKKGGDFMPGETQPLELPDGSILVNTRNSEAFHCRCRIIAQSYDGGASFSFSNVTINEELVDPGCEGSTIIHNNIMYFSNPNTHSGRLNMTVKYSTDFGKHWDVAVNVYSGSSEYSCLSPIDDNNIGVLYERDGYHKMGFAKIRLN